MSVSLAQGGAGLGAMWGEQRAREMFAEAGLDPVGVARVEGDIVNNYYIATKLSGGQSFTEVVMPCVDVREMHVDDERCHACDERLAPCEKPSRNHSHG